MITGTPGLDLVISGGTVIDGTGAPRRRADVGVAGGRIVAIGDLSAATDGVERMDATGLIVAPGLGGHAQPLRPDAAERRPGPEQGRARA